MLLSKSMEYADPDSVLWSLLDVHRILLKVACTHRYPLLTRSTIILLTSMEALGEESSILVPKCSASPIFAKKKAHSYN